jgi:hypothetical protein
MSNIQAYGGIITQGYAEMAAKLSFRAISCPAQANGKPTVNQTKDN